MPNLPTRTRSVARVAAAAALIVAASASAQTALRAVPEAPGGGGGSGGGPASPFGPGFDMDWYTIDGGGATYLVGGGFELGATVGQPDVGSMTGGGFEFSGGFWAGVGAAACYANCDGSTAAPALNVNDFQCFLNRYAAGDPYANCDGSTTPPILNVNDFQCFLNAYAIGCP